MLCFFLAPTSLPHDKSQIGVAEGFPVLQGCSFEVQEQLPPDAFHGVTKDFYRIQTQGWRVTNLVPYPLSHGIDNAHNI